MCIRDRFDVQSFFTATASAAGRLDLWIDFDNNGTFDADEHLGGGTSYDLVAGANSFDFTLEAGTVTTGVPLAVRARFSSAGGLAPTGRASDGEVEDYSLTVSPLLPAQEVVRVFPTHSQTSDLTPILRWRQGDGTPAGANATYNVTSVSYTHLTLPTILRV